MKPLIVTGILLILAGISINVQFPGAGSWMFQVGLIFLFGALAVSRNVKIWTISGLFFMVALFLLGLFNGMWYAHPLGGILGIVAGGWVAYWLIKDKQNESGDTSAVVGSNQFQKLLPVVKQNIKWVSVPLGILIILALTKSILVAFIVGAGIVGFLDKQAIQAKGLNRVAIILLLYTVGFLVLLVGTFKIDVAYNYPNFSFFSRDSYIFLRDIMQGL